MTPEQNYLVSLVTSALDEFNAQESYLIQNDLSERCICSKFAQHLQESLKKSPDYPDYVVDVEYNRGAKGKEYLPKRDPNNNKIIIVDLIVHKRGYNPNVHRHGARNIVGFSNLICIEMKKSNNTRNIQADKDRLEMMTGTEGDFTYTAGFMLVVNMKKKLIEIESQFLQ